ncbi:hypothetical protein EMCRGX_G030664 [Ephydatia muelleri]
MYADIWRGKRVVLMSDDKHLLVVFPTVLEPRGTFLRKINRTQFCRVEDITSRYERQNRKRGVGTCRREDDFIELLSRVAPQAVTVTRELGEDVDIDSVIKRKYRPIGVVRALSHIMDLTQLVELRVVGVTLPEHDCQNMKFGALLSLRLLTLDAVGLHTLHPSIGRLKGLRTLSLQHNLLYDLPLTMQLLRELETLNVTGNFFPILPGVVFHLSRLQNLIGVEACPLQLEPEWNKCDQLFWVAPPTCPSTQLRSLKAAAAHSAVGDCSGEGFPQECTDRLAEVATTHDLCENCFSAIVKLTPQQETTGYILKVQIPEFCGIRNVPFCFMACSQGCRDEVELKMKHVLREQRQRLAELEERGVWLAQHLYQVECSDIWEMRRRSRLGRGVDANLRADPAELAENLDLVLVETELIAQVLGIEAVQLVDMVSPV